MPKMEESRIADMRLFAALAEHASFVRAARALRVPPSTLSRRIAALEAALGVRLVHRTTRSFALTAAGEQFAARCTAVAELAERAEREIRDLEGADAGRVRLTAPVLLGEALLGPIVADLRIHHPRITLDIVLLDRRVDLFAEGFDLAIRIGALADSSLVTRSLGTASVRAYASPDAARDAPLVAFGGLRGTTAALDVRASPRHGAPVVACNSQRVVRDLVVAGAGIAMLPDFFVADDVRAGRLIVRGRDAHAVPVSLLYRDRTHLPRRVRSVADALVERIPRLLRRS
jgi:DNA-binding transcriptional LysR family regulator